MVGPRPLRPLLAALLLLLQSLLPFAHVWHHGCAAHRHGNGGAVADRVAPWDGGDAPAARVEVSGADADDEHGGCAVCELLRGSGTLVGVDPAPQSCFAPPSGALPSSPPSAPLLSPRPRAFAARAPPLLLV